MPDAGRQSLLAALALALATLFWAGNWIVGRAVALDELMPPLALNFWRWTLAAVVMTPWIWKYRKTILANVRFFLPAGLLSATIFQWFVYIGLQKSEAINAIIINSFVPAMIPVIAWLMYRTTVTRTQIVGLVVSFIGVLVILSRGDISVLTSLKVNPGDWWILAATPSWAIYTVLLTERPKNLSTAGVLAGVALFGWLGLLAAVLVSAAMGRTVLPPLTWEVAAAIGYVGLFASVFAVGLWNLGVTLIGPTKAGVYSHLLPPYGAVLSVIFLSERPTIWHAVGFAVILVGIYLTMKVRR